MAGVDYEPTVGWTPDALIGELEQRVETMAGALDEVRELLRRLAAERALQDVLSQNAAASTAIAVPVEVPDAEIENKSAPEPIQDMTPMAVLEKPEPVLDETFELHAEETSESAFESAVATEMPVSVPELEPPAVEVTRYTPETPSTAHDGLPAPQSPSYHDMITDVPAPEDDDFDVARDEVRRAVELMRSEIESGYYGPRDQGPLELEGQTETYDDDVEVNVDPATVEAAREEVRRAVEQARRDLARGTMQSPLGDFTTPATADLGDGHVEFRTHVPTGGHAPLPSQLPEASHFDESRLLSPSIVIEDMQGRVELVRVFDTLSRVNCAGQAVLLNYTPHSVTVGLGMNDAPGKEELAEAVRQVFGRPCSIVSEGARLAVTLNHGRAA